MNDTKILIMCPSCSSLDVYKKKERYAKAMKLIIPGNTPREAEHSIFHCQQCGLMFNELEGMGEE